MALWTCRVPGFASVKTPATSRGHRGPRAAGATAPHRCPVRGHGRWRWV